MSHREYLAWFHSELFPGPITKVNKEMSIKRAYDFSFAVQADKKLTRDF